MRIDEVLYTLPRQSAAVESIVGTKVVPLRKLQKTPYPALVYKVTRTMDGLNMAGPDGLRVVEFELASLATTYTDARVLADAVREQMHGYRGTVNGADIAIDFNFILDSYNTNITKVQGVWITDEDDMYHDDPKRFGVLQTYKIYFCE